MSEVTIGFVPRERFSLAAESLQRIFDYTRIPFALIVVDCNIPAPYWEEMERVLEGRSNVDVIHRDRYLLPNQSKNLVIEEASGEYLCMIENDVLVQEDWLSTLIAACEEHPADVAVPLIVEGPLGTKDVHFDDALGEVRHIQGPEGSQLEIVPREEDKEYGWNAERQTVQFMEQHCLLFRRSVFDRIGPYDEALNTRDEIDLSLSLYDADVPVVFEPKCVVHYIPPFPPRRDEVDYFFMKWDLHQGARSRARIREKWNLVEVPGSMEFVKDRNRIGQLHEVRKRLEALAASGAPFILVDQERLRGTGFTDGLPTIPFVEKDGQYWGAPEDDDEAIRELERLRQIGARVIVFVWFTRWWLDYYSEFCDYLRSQFRRVLDNDRLVVFDLEPEAAEPSDYGTEDAVDFERPVARH